MSTRSLQPLRRIISVIKREHIPRVGLESSLPRAFRRMFISSLGSSWVHCMEASTDVMRQASAPRPCLPPLSTNEIDPRRANMSLFRERALFKEAFTTSYAKLSSDELVLPSGSTLDTFLDDAFSEDEDAWRNTAEAERAASAHRFYNAEAVVDGETVVVGYISVDVVAGGTEIYVRQLAVAPEFQRRGVGSRLMKTCLGEQVLVARVCHRKGNTGAQALYERLGFVPDEDTHGLDPDVYEGKVWRRK